MHKETVRIEIVNSDASDEDDEEEDYFCFHYSPVKQPQVATCNPDTENNEVDELEAEEVEPEMQNDSATEPSEKVLTDDTGSDNGITEEESSIPDQGTEDDEMEEEYHRPQRERRALFCLYILSCHFIQFRELQNQFTLDRLRSLSEQILT